MKQVILFSLLVLLCIFPAQSFGGSVQTWPKNGILNTINDLIGGVVNFFEGIGSSITGMITAVPKGSIPSSGTKIPTTPTSPEPMTTLSTTTSTSTSTSTTTSIATTTTIPTTSTSTTTTSTVETTIPTTTTIEPTTTVNETTTTIEPNTTTTVNETTTTINETTILPVEAQTKNITSNETTTTVETTTTINQTLNNALNQNNTLNETNITLTTLPSTTSTILTTTSTIPTTTSTLETTTVPTTLETTTTLNETELPNLVIGVAMPKKITRGQKFSITVSVNNLGGPASGLDVSLLLPDGFEVISYDSDCSSLSYGQTCSALFVVNSSLSASLGANNFGVLVRYE